jgi:hypothetical protein
MTTKDRNGNDIRKGCLNKDGKCRAQFPRDVVEQTLVDPMTGALIIKKGEAWLNTFTPTITYVLRCNTDTTSLLSGTAIKAIVAYVSDYVTKPGSPCYAKLYCETCNKIEPADAPENMMHVTSSILKSTNSWFQNWQEEPTANCLQCQSGQKVLCQFSIAPEMLVFGLNVTGIAISKTVRVKDANNKDSMLPLKGVVYSGEFHFTSRIISGKDVWYHDGMITRSKCWNEGSATSFSEKKYMSCNNKDAVLAIYAKK